MKNIEDMETAKAFSNSWINCFSKSPYTLEQVKDWLEPIKLDELENLNICEMGCGNGGILQHIARFSKKNVTAIELGESINSARKNFKRMGIDNVNFVRSDMQQYALKHQNEFDFVYCIGVIHHLKNPEEGFNSVVKATKQEGRFHCWVYAHEGNFIVRTFIDPIRKATSRLPWWFNKYAIAFPLTFPFFIISQLVKNFPDNFLIKKMPLYSYFKWISSHGFQFHHHVAFDQLVAPHTTYIKQKTIEDWLDKLQCSDTYILFRNRNSWKFGGRKKY